MESHANSESVISYWTELLDTQLVVILEKLQTLGVRKQHTIMDPELTEHMP